MTVFIKKCTSCKNELEANSENFYKSSSGKYGYSAKCKTCKSVVNKASNEKHKDKIKSKRDSKSENKKEYDKVYNKTNAERIKERSKKHYHENIEVMRNRSKEYNANPEVKLHRKLYREKRKDRDKELYIAWREINRDRIRQIKKRRYQAERSVICNLTIEEWNICLDYFDNQCSYCGNYQQSMSQDHFIPVTKNGNYTFDNIVPACRSCNSSKNNSDFEQWYYWQPFYSEERELKLLEYLGFELEMQ